MVVTFDNIKPRALALTSLLKPNNIFSSHKFSILVQTLNFILNAIYKNKNKTA